MDISQLRYFMATAKHLNYTKASEDLFISRQALRQSIQGLEHDLGAPLFQNRSNRLSLTSTGLALQEKAQALLDHFDAMEKEVRAISNPFQRITLACSESILAFLFPDFTNVIKTFESEYPDIPVSLTVTTNNDIWTMLQDKTCHFGILMAMPWHSPEYTFLPLQSFSLGLTSTRFRGPSRKTSLTLSDLQGQKLLGMGDLETSFRPLAKDLQKYDITVDFETVSNAIDAFYQMKHGESYLVNITEADKGNLPDSYTIPLCSYQWPLCLVFPTAHALASQEEFFIKYLKTYLDKHPITF